MLSTTHFNLFKVIGSLQRSIISLSRYFSETTLASLLYLKPLAFRYNCFIKCHKCSFDLDGLSLSLSKRENVNLDTENGPFAVEFKANIPSLTLNTGSSVGVFAVRDI